MAVQLVSEILPVRGVEIAGMFPEAVQRYAVLSSCIAADCVNRAAAEALVSHFRHPSTEFILANAGLERCYRVG